MKSCGFRAAFAGVVSRLLSFPLHRSLFAIGLIGLLSAPGPATAQQMFRYVGQASKDCNGTYPQVYFNNAVAGRDLVVTVLGHPRQPANMDQPTSAPDHPSQKVLLFGMIVNSTGSNINPAGVNIGSDLTLYINNLNDVVSFGIVDLDSNGTWSKTIPTAATQAGTEVYFQALAVAPPTSNPKYKKRHCTTDHYSASPGTIIKLQPPGLNGATVTNSSTFTDGGITLTFDQPYAQGVLADNRPYVIAPNGLWITGSSHPSTHFDFSEQMFALTNPEAGTFRLTFNGQTTGAIPYNSTASNLESALEALSNVDDVTVRAEHIPDNDFYRFNVRFNVTSSTPTLMTLNTSLLQNLSPYNLTVTGEIEPRVRNGGTLNFKDNRMWNVFDSGESEMYKQDLGFNYADNIMADISPSSPRFIPAGSTLIQCRSRQIALGGASSTSFCEEYLTLYVSPNGLKDGSFAPPFAGVAKPIFNIAAIDESLLQNLPPPSGATITYAQALNLARVRGPMISDGGTNYRKVIDENQYAYGRDYNDAKGQALLYLNTNQPMSSKRPVLYSMIQDAINQWGVSNTNRYSRIDSWSNNFYDGLAQNGGHQAGTLFLAVMGKILKDPMQDMFLNGKNYAERYIYRYLTQSDITAYGYNQQLLNAPEWFMEMSAPGDPLMSISYRFCCSANGLQAQALAMRIMGLDGLAGNPAMFDYLNRYVTQIVPTYNWTQFYSPFTQQMHATYSVAF